MIYFKQLVLSSGIFLSLISASHVSLAQGQPTRIKGGINISTVTDFSGEAGNKPQLGFYAGVSKDIMLSSSLDFQSGLIYSLLGNKTDLSRMRYHYLQVPLLLNFKSNSRSGWTIGPQIGLLAGATMKLDDGRKGSIMPLARTIDVSIAGGPYADITDRLRAEFRAGFGLTNMAMDKQDVSHHLVLQIGLLWSLPGINSEQE